MFHIFGKRKSPQQGLCSGCGSALSSDDTYMLNKQKYCGKCYQEEKKKSNKTITTKDDMLSGQDAKKESAAPVSVSGIERLSNRCFCQDCAYRDSKNKYEQNCDHKMLFHLLQLLFLDPTDINEISCKSVSSIPMGRKIKMQFTSLFILNFFRNEA